MSELSRLLRAYDAAEAASEEKRNCFERDLKEVVSKLERERAEAIEEIERLEDELDRQQEVWLNGCDCAPDEACKFARERDEARAEVERLRKALMSTPRSEQ